MVPFVYATLGAIAMALAFPKTNAAVLAPLGAAALFYAWFGLSPIRAFWVGWIAGTVFFAIDFWWFGETAGALIAPFGFALALGPAIGDAFFGFALVGALVALAAQALRRRDRVSRALVPVASAAIFAVGEWLRSEGLGVIGVPFGSLGFTQIASPLAPVAALGGTYAVAFAVATIGATIAYAIAMRGVRGSSIDAGLGALGVLLLVAISWLAWPVHDASKPTVRVAAIQGNIAQSLKFTPDAFANALDRYTALTVRAAAFRPALIVWPETVITAALNKTPALQARFSALAKRANSELVVGTFFVEGTQEYNALYFFRPDGGLDAIYRKRQLVPFAEHLPFAAALSWIPWARNASHFSTGTSDGIVNASGLRFGPIVCWESAFTDLVGDDVRDGASALIVATDDAWFGTTAGPYQHAQIAQMRALETGRWIVRAASTGISGIISPRGRYTRASALDTQAIVTGVIGTPIDTVYDRIGGNGVTLALGLLAFAIVAYGRRAGVRAL